MSDSRTVQFADGPLKGDSRSVPGDQVVIDIKRQGVPRLGEEEVPIESGSYVILGKRAYFRGWRPSSAPCRREGG